jgi:hypothetical protein
MAWLTSTGAESVALIGAPIDVIAFVIDVITATGRRQVVA